MSKEDLIQLQGEVIHVGKGGIRFREAYNERFVGGIRFVDYYNLKPKSKTSSILDIDELYELNFDEK